MLNHNDAAMVAAIRTLQESLTNEEYTVIMDEAVSLVESGVTANNADAIKFIASKQLDETTYALVESVMDEATKAGTVGAHMAKGAIDHALGTGIVGAAIGATSINPTVRSAKNKLNKAKDSGDDDEINAAREKLKAARIAGAKEKAIYGVKRGAAIGAISGGLTGVVKVANESTSIMGAIWGEPIDEALTSDEAARVQKRINKAHPTVSDPAWNKLTALNSQRNIQPAHSQAAVGGFLSDKIKMQRAAAAHGAKPRYMGG